MRFSLFTVAFFAGLAMASPIISRDPKNDAAAANQDDASGADTIAQIQATFDRDNPNVTPAAGSPDDLNGDGVINVFEAGAQASKRSPRKGQDAAAADTGAIDGGSTIADLQATFDRNNPNGTPAAGSPDDLNGDGVINVFEAGAQAS